MDLQSVTALALLGSVAAFYTQIKGFVLRIASIFVKTEEVHITNYTVFQEAIKFLMGSSYIVNWGNKKHICKGYYSGLDNHSLCYGLSFFDSYLLIFRRKHFVILKIINGGQFNITYLNFYFPLKTVLAEAITKANELYELQQKTSTRALCFCTSEREGFDISELGARGGANASGGGNNSAGNANNNNGGGLFFGSAADNIGSDIHLLRENTDFIHGDYKDINYRSGYVKPKQEEYYWSEEAVKLSKEMEFWLGSERWFKERGLSWKRGALLYGTPGGGKSKMVLQCAKKHRLHLMKINLSNMSNKEFDESIKIAVDHSIPTIVLLEDIDVIFHGRKNMLQTEGGKALITFDTIINAINGVKNVGNIFIIATTNNIDVLDAALTRSGRLDVKIEVKPISKEGRYFIAKNILRDWPEIMEKTVADCEGCSAADFENLCIELAHNMFFKQRAEKVDE